MKSKLHSWPRFFLAAAFLVQSFVALASVHWLFELFTHYAPYYVLIALGFSVFHLFKKEWLWTACWTTLLFVNLLPILPYLTTTVPLNSPSLTSYQAPELSILTQNVYYKNTDTAEFYARVDELSPTIFVVNEAHAIWGTAQSEVLRDYPSTAITEKTGVHGIFMGSKVPGTFTEIPLGQQVGLEFIPEDKSYRVLGVHPEAPVSFSWATGRNEQFEDLITYANSSELPTIIIGDFNCTPWSPYFKNLISKSGLTDSRLGFGMVTTWKANSLLFWLPIDHALVSPNVQVLDFTSYKTEVSDHKAIEVQVSF